jgi:hypothetical protein
LKENQPVLVDERPRVKPAPEDVRKLHAARIARANTPESIRAAFDAYTRAVAALLNQ